MCKVRLAYRCTLRFKLKKLGCFAYIHFYFFLPTFELLKLEFSECVFQADSFFSFFLENLSQNWLAISNPSGKKHSSLILKTIGFFFFFPIL